MSQHSKYLTVIFLTLSMGMIFLIAAGLPALELRPGWPFPHQDSGSLPLSTGGQTPVDVQPGRLLPIFQAFLAVGLLLAGGYLTYLLVTQAGLKRILSASVFLTVVLMLLRWLPAMPINRENSWSQPTLRATALPQLKTPVVPLDPPSFLTVLILIGLALLAAALITVVLHRAVRDRVENRLEQEAARAIAALQAGEDLKNVVLRCYQRMSQALQEEQGLGREVFMTVQEFELLLQSRGVPAEPVRQLTHLFEMVRYGRHTPRVQDEQIALSSLKAILHYSRNSGQK